MTYEEFYGNAYQTMQQAEIEIAKANGYRSYHLLLSVITGPGNGLQAEIQVRTIANDFWATLEHRLKYKKTFLMRR